MKVIYVHGVNQTVTNAGELANIWSRSLEAGGVSPAKLAAANPAMAYYHDILAAGRTEIGMAAAAKMDADRIKFLREVSIELYSAMRAMAVNTPGMDPIAYANNLIAPDQPFGARETRGFLSEVYDYLTKPALRQAIDDRVVASLGNQPQTIIAHSLGSVVAYRLLRDRRITCRRLITLGSPLSYKTVRQKLDGQFAYPAQLQDWYNFYDPLDLACLGRAFPNPATWVPRLQHVKVNNPSLSSHAIGGYLQSAKVNTAVAAML
jgi:hypothetical protein